MVGYSLQYDLSVTPLSLLYDDVLIYTTANKLLQ